MVLYLFENQWDFNTPVRPVWYNLIMKNQTFIEDSYYHIYNRGNSKQKIFLDKEDYNRFLNLLYKSPVFNFYNSKLYQVKKIKK